MELQNPNMPVDECNERETNGERVVEDALVTDDLLVEDVSIDGMCGVY